MQQYTDYYSDTSIDRAQILCEIETIARSSPDTCLSCIYSRLDKNKCDYSIRKCMFEYSLKDAECINIREGFERRIRKRER